MRAPRIPSIALALAVLPAALAAQTRPTFLTGAEFRSVTFGAGIGTKTVTELAVPMGFILPLGRRATIDVGTYYVNARRTDEADSSASISGLTDLVIRGNFQLKQDVAVLTLSLNVPTGQATLDGSQDLVARAVATDLIPFPVSNFGTGFNVTSGLAFAVPVGPWAIGLAGSYRYNAAYEPFSSTDSSLKPGGEVRMRFGADRVVGQGRVSLGLTYSTFANDEFAGTSRRPGARIIPQVSWSFPMGRNNSLALYAWDVYRNVDETSAPGAAKENTIAAGAVMSLRSGRNTLRPMVEFRTTAKGPGGLQANGTLFGIGLRYSMAAGSRLSITPGVRFDMGSIPTGTGASASLTGIGGSLTIRTSM